MEIDMLNRASADFGCEKITPKMAFQLDRDLADDGIDVSVACRVLGVFRSGLCDWLDRPPSDGSWPT